MERFSARFRERFDKKAVLDAIEASCDRLNKLKRTRVDVPALVAEAYHTGRMPRAPIKLLALTQNAIRRGLELADSMIRDTNAFTYTPVWTSARSLFELASLIFDCYDKVFKLTQTWDMTAYLQFNEHLDMVSLGFKSKEWHPARESGSPADLELQARSVLGIMQRIQRDHIPHYFELYELLSEVAHPNYMGMMEAYQITGDGLLTIDFVDDPANRDPKRLGIPLDAADGALDLLASSIEKFEAVFVEFARLIAAKTIDDDSGNEALEKWAGRL